MVSPLRRLLVGPSPGRRPYLVAPVALFVVTFVAYATEVFEVSGGLVFIPWDAAVVGVAAVVAVGYRRAGLVLAWLVAYAPLLGYRADHAFLGLPRRTFREQLAYFLRPDGLAFLGVEALVLETVAFIAGAFVNWGFKVLRDRTAPS